VAFPPDAVFGNNVIIGQNHIDNGAISDLFHLFGDSDETIVEMVQHRFDRLPTHSIVYYQTYHQGVLQELTDATNLTCNQQDCLGMTPLHTLTCSSMHDIELYRVIVENYPTNLIAEDSWGALPLLYAFWGAAPTEIIEFLLESYQSFFPSTLFIWTMMVETLGRCDTPKESIENL
jgi:ankyrin repeat protein